jgi:hypothetical protein
MKKIILALALTLSLAGCGTLQNIQTAVQLGNVSIDNPVTQQRLYELENAAILLFAGLKTWKRSCAEGVLPPTCRDQVAAVQAYTRKIPPYLAQLRLFVRSGDQVNAINVWNNVISVINVAKTQAAANGVNVGS